MKTNSEIVKAVSYELTGGLQSPYHYPVFDPRYPFDYGSEITNGDLHANLMSLNNLCMRAGIYSLEQEQYKKLRNIFFTRSEEYSKETIQEFLDILGTAKISEKNSKGKLRLLGDEVADRNGCDLLMLYFFKFLHENNINFIIILSNHAFELLYHYEKGSSFGECYVSNGQKDNPYIHSLLTMQKLIDKAIISREEVNELIKNYYLPYLSCIDYSLSKNNRLTWYTHSYAPAKIVRFLADDFGVHNPSNILKNDPQAQIATLDAIQENFKKIIARSTTHKHVEINCTENGFDESKWTPLGWLIWTRYLETQEPCDDYILHVNGHHTLSDKPADNYLVLDSMYGKDNLSLIADKDTQDIFEQERRLEKLIEGSFSEHCVYYTHESKRLHYWHFRKMFNDLKEKKPVIELSEQEMADILDENCIFSSYQIESLQFFLYEGTKTKHFWQTLSRVDLPKRIVREAITKNVYLRDVIYLLHQKNAITAQNILFLMGNSIQDLQLIFSTLLITDNITPKEIAKYILFPPAYKERLEQVCTIARDKNQSFATLINKKLISMATVNIFNKVKEMIPVGYDCSFFNIYGLAELNVLLTLKIPIQEDNFKKILIKQLIQYYPNKAFVLEQYPTTTLTAFLACSISLKNTDFVGDLGYLFAEKDNLFNAVAIWSILSTGEKLLASHHLKYILQPENFKFAVSWFQFLRKNDCLNLENIMTGNYLDSKKYLSAELIKSFEKNPQELLALMITLFDEGFMTNAQHWQIVCTITENFTNIMSFEEIKELTIKKLEQEYIEVDEEYDHSSSPNSGSNMSA